MKTIFIILLVVYSPAIVYILCISLPLLIYYVAVVISFPFKGILAVINKLSGKGEKG